jgi:DNA-binding MarR family transcriptional regulator
MVDTAHTDSCSDLVDAFMTASRVLMGVAARSLAQAPTDLSLAGYRTLVILYTRGPRRISELAEDLNVHSSNASRQCMRLQSIGAVRKQRATADRRAVEVALTPPGRRIVDAVMAARRVEIERVVGLIEDEDFSPLVTALRRFAEVTGEPAEGEWTQPPPAL